MYKIKIEKFVDNPYFADDLKHYQNGLSFGNPPTYPSKTISVSVTDTEITDEQFAAVRKALIEVM